MVFNAYDFEFHWSRIYEIHQSFINGTGFPRVALNGFLQDGSAGMTMYPSFNLFF